MKLLLKSPLSIYKNCLCQGNRDYNVIPTFIVTWATLSTLPNKSVCLSEYQNIPQDSFGISFPLWGCYVLEIVAIVTIKK